MLFVRKSLVPALVSIIFLFVVGYAMMYTYVKLTDVLYLDSLDTNITDDPPSNIPDVSGMFNERGYLNSNSFSFDENEIVNDFNGNLMYSIPIAHSKGQGDLYMDLSINYNGSVSHSIIVSNTTIAGYAGTMKQYTREENPPKRWQQLQA